MPRGANANSNSLSAPVDVLVIGGGVTGAGVALDAASRGLLRRARREARSGLRHQPVEFEAGARRAALPRVRRGRHRARERGRARHPDDPTAPHLVRALPQVVPLLPSLSHRNAALIRAGFAAGDVLRVSARTPGSVLPHSRRIARGRGRTLRADRPHRRAARRAAGWDGQLVDDARLVVAIARTAAAHGARILTRCAASAGHRPRRGAARHAHRRDGRRRRAHGDQRCRRVGRAARAGHHAAPQPRHAPRRVAGQLRRADRRAHRPGRRHDQPVRLRAAGAGPAGVHRAHRRGRAG